MSPSHDRRRGLSLMEVLAVVTLMGIIAIIVVPRFSDSSTNARVTSCDANRNNIDIQAQLWFRNNGDWDDFTMNGLMNDPDYFPDGPVTCPVDGSDYEFDTATERVTGHEH